MFACGCGSNRAVATNVSLAHTGGALKLEVSAAPEKGRANAAVIRLLSDALGLRRNQVEIVAGASSQDKTAVLTGCSVEEIAARLAMSNIPAGNTPAAQRS